MKQEIWKDIPGYEDLYQASNLGRIKGKEGRITYSKLHGKRTWKERILKQKVSKDDTCRVSLYKNNKEKTWLVHRLVAKTFIPRIKGKDYINHIDGNRLNNEVKNLEWCDHTENNNHAFDTGLIKTNVRTILINKETGEKKEFRSMAKASEYIGRNLGYVSRKVKEGKSLKDYEIKKVGNNVKIN